MTVFGIDLGTTFSSIGVFQSGVQHEVIQDSMRQRAIASVVKYEKAGKCVVGQSAVNRSSDNPRRTIFDSKRMLGRRFRDKEVKEMMEHWPFTVVGDDRDQLFVELPGLAEGDPVELVEPYKVSGEILKYLASVGNKRNPEPVKDCVITVPANFSDAQRAETLKAAEYAGLNVVKLLNEPTAAAIAFCTLGTGSTRHQEGLWTVLIFDFGGGTLDVSLMEVENNKFTVKAVAGDTELGGRNFDDKVLDYVLKREDIEHVRKEPKRLAKIRQAIVELKVALSNETDASLYVENGKGPEQDLNCEITRDEFVEVCRPLFDRLLGPVKETLEWAGKSKDEIDDVILVGGSTHIPEVKRILEEYFGKTAYQGVDPLEAVVLGAAIVGANAREVEGLSDEVDINRLEVTDISPLSVGIRCGGDVMEVVMPRGTSFGSEVKKQFGLPYNYCQSIVIDVFEGERLLTKYNRLLGSFVLSGIPKGQVGEVFVDVTFILDKNGILTATAKCSDACKGSVRIEKQRAKYSASELQNLLSAADVSKEEDEKEYKLRVEYTYFVNLHLSTLQYLESIKSKAKLYIGEEKFARIMERCIGIVKNCKLEEIKLGMYGIAKARLQEELKYVCLREGDFPPFLE